MLKVILGAFFGITVTISGIYAGYLYLTSLEDGGNIIFLILFLLLTGGGIAILYKSGKSDATIVKKVKIDRADIKPETNFESMLEKNNQLSEEWSRTIESKDKLKMLQMAAGAEEQAKKERNAS